MTVTLVPSLPPTSDVPGNIGGVDTHKATHYAALIDARETSWITDSSRPRNAATATCWTGSVSTDR